MPFTISYRARIAALSGNRRDPVFVNDGLKRLQIEQGLSHGTALTLLFEAAGRTLIYLDVDKVPDEAGPDAYRFDLTTISGWCPRVRSLFVNFPRNSVRAEDQRQALILSYGSQLKWTGRCFWDFNAEFWLSFLSNCPNAKVDCNPRGKHVSSFLSMLGPRLRKLKSSTMRYSLNTGIRAAVEACSNVDILSIEEQVNDDGIVWVSACFFGTPKPKQRHMTMTRPRMGDFTGTDSFCGIAENTGGLRSIDIYIRERIGRIGMRQLADANVFLEKIVFRIGEVSIDFDEHVAYVVDIVESISGCPLLQSIHVAIQGVTYAFAKANTIVDPCVGMRHRGKSV